MWHRLIPRISRSARQSFLAMIAFAGLTFVCFWLQLNISTAGFLYLIVIVLLSHAGDYVASVVTSVVAAVCLAYFFAPPIFSIRVDDPLNIVAIIAFLTTSLVISRLVSEVRTRSGKMRLNEYYLSEGQRLAHMGCWAFDATGFSYWSSELFRVHGLDPRGQPPMVEEYLALIHPEDRAFMKQGIAKMLDDHLAFDFTKRIVRPDGEIRRVRSVGIPVTQGGLFHGFLGTEMDVTDQEQLTEELRRSEKELRDAIDTIPAIVWSALPDGSNTYVNKRFIEYSGLSAEQTAGSGWQAAIHPDDLERQVGKWIEAVATGKPLENEVRFRRSDGQYRCHLDRGVPLRDEDVNIVKWYGVTTDIEDRKRAEEALHESEKSLRLIVDGIAGMVAIMTAEGQVEFANSQVLEYFGKTLEDLKGWSTSDAVHPDDLHNVVAAWMHSVETGDPYDVDHRLRRFDGAYRWFHSRGLSLRDAEGRIVHWYNLLTDIDERKRWEEKLRRSEAYLSEAQKLSHTGSFGWKPDDGEIVWSDETYRIFEYDSTLKPTVDSVVQRIHPYDRVPARQVIDRASKTGTDFEHEYRLLLADGRVKYVHAIAHAVQNVSGNREFIGAVTDITDRKRAEEALALMSRDLQESKTRLEEAQRIAHVGHWVWDQGKDGLTWSDETYRIFGMRPQERSMSVEAFQEMIHPEDREFLLRATQEARGGGRPDTEFRIVRPSGEVRIVHSQGAVTRDVPGQPRQRFGAIQDITDRKRAEEELQQSQFYLAEGQRLAHIGSWALNTVGFDYWSSELFQIHGLDPRGKPPTAEEYLTVVYPDDREFIKQEISKMLADHCAFDFTKRIVRPDGEIRYVRCVGIPVTRGEIFQGFVGTGIDVTEQELLEQERERLRQLETELAHTNRVSMLGEMAASLAHEIKQPIAAAMTSANSCIEWLAHEPPNLDRARAAAAKIDKYGNRAAEIIDHIRSLYRKSPPQSELIDVNEIVHEIFTLLQCETIRYSIAMRFELAGELPKIKADRVQLQQVFMNLMLNAIEAMRDEGGELTVKSQLQDSQLLLSVSDTGVGLPTAKMEEIFAAFFTTKPQGSGMGLAISRSIVESHGGRLWATANDVRGATFHFTLPTEVMEPTPLVFPPGLMPAV
jgi:PAS domain S-box-containing protein